MWTNVKLKTVWQLILFSIDLKWLRFTIKASSNSYFNYFQHQILMKSIDEMNIPLFQQNIFTCSTL